MERVFDIGKGVMLGEGHPCVLILDAGVNHNNDPARAMELIRTAAEGGAHVIKFQTYTADEISTRTAPRYWDPTLDRDGGKSQHDMFAKVDKLPAGAYYDMRDYARELNIVFSSSPFGVSSATFLRELDIDFFKIASAEVTNEPVLRIAAESGKPIVLSTGACTIGEVEAAIEILEKAGNDRIGLQHCILSYPCRDEDANLAKMLRLKQIFPDLPVGYSDHTYGNAVPLAAVAMGARSIEKHYTVDASLPDSPDHGFSLTPQGLKEFMRDAARIQAAHGSYVNGPYPAEAKAHLYARKSIVAVDRIARGTTITPEMVSTKRPGTGIYPQYLPYVVGRQAKVDIEPDTILDWEMI